MRILLAIDSSRQSGSAVQSIVERPWPADSVVRVLTVVSNTPPSAAELWADFTGDLRLLQEHRREDARRLLDEAAALIRTRGIKAETQIEDGNPRRRILEQAREWSADLILLAPHWTTAWERWVAGSITLAIVKRARCAVEIYRGTGHKVRTA